MTKEVEAFENIKREAGTPYFSSLYDIDDWKDDLKTVGDALRSLSILKKTLSFNFEDFDFLGRHFYKVYIESGKDKIVIFLDKKDFELLKEVLL